MQAFVKGNVTVPHVKQSVTQSWLSLLLSVFLSHASDAVSRKKPLLLFNSTVDHYRKLWCYVAYLKHVLLYPYKAYIFEAYTV